MKKKIIVIASIILVSILLVVLIFYSYNAWRIAHARIDVEVKDLEVEVFSKVKLKDFIKSINGEIDDNFSIDTTKIGKKDISFSYVNDENIKVPFNFTINVVDKIAPYIGVNNNYYLEVGYDGDFESSLFCGDNYDDTPKCSIEGGIDYNTLGNYPVKYVAVDSSGNTNSRDITINIIEKKDKSDDTEEDEDNFVLFSDIVEQYKNKNTKIGIDVSRWQGDIDFEKVKNSGVEFVFIRIGYGVKKGKGYTMDPNFIKNIEGFNKVGIPVGVYFYSYASNEKEAISEAKWTVKQLKKYKVDLPVAFDWENWSNYRDYNLSFYHLTGIAKSFMKTVEDSGYSSMLYSSKNYLENIWFDVDNDVWLANYNFDNTYQGKFKIWQLTNTGRVDGIGNNFVDINIMY